MKKLKCPSGGVIVRVLAAGSIAMSSIVIGVAASIQGKFVAKLRVPADINVVHSPELLQY